MRPIETNSAFYPSGSSWDDPEGGYVTPEGIRKLAVYKYTGGPYSYLDLFLNPMWLWIASKVPRTISPNMVTFSGFCMIICSTSIMALRYSGWFSSCGIGPMVADNGDIFSENTKFGDYQKAETRWYDWPQSALGMEEFRRI